MHIATITTKNKKTGKVYINHKLIQTIRTEKGPRNRVVMSLGKLNLPKDDLKKLAFVLEGRITGQASFFEDEGYINYLKRNYRILEVSIHAPARGATALVLARFLLDAGFNPRTRTGCDYIYLPIVPNQ